jgi:hypothetical protein
MKKHINDIIKISKLDVSELRAVINIDNCKDENDFNLKLIEIDKGLINHPFRWSRIENFANVNKNITIVFTY